MATDTRKQELVAAKSWLESAKHVGELVSACLDENATPTRLAKAAGRAIEDASRLQGLANLVSKSAGRA